MALWFAAATAPRTIKPIDAGVHQLYIDTCRGDTRARGRAIVDWVFLNSHARHDAHKPSTHWHHPCNSRV